METRKALAVEAVIRTLQCFKEGRALAGQLETELAATGISVRQARRWLKWARTGPSATVTKTKKGADGTWYCLPGQAPCQLPVAPASRGSFFETVPTHVRRDVALVVRALQGAGGSLVIQDLGRVVAQRAGRPLLWGAAAVEMAVSAGRPQAVTFGRGGGPHPVVVLTAGAEIGDADLWTEPTVFAFPRDPAALTRHFQRRLGDPALNLSAGATAVVLALADLGGTATVEELHIWPYTDRRAALQGLIELRRDGWKTPWLVNEAGGRRLRLASGLWP